jgi:hypothetical protein
MLYETYENVVDITVYVEQNYKTSMTKTTCKGKLDLLISTSFLPLGEWKLWLLKYGTCLHINSSFQWLSL